MEQARKLATLARRVQSVQYLRQIVIRLSMLVQ